MNDLDWPRLKEYKCPRPACGWKLQFNGLLSSDITCTNPHCLFRIGDDRMQEILKSMTKKRAPYEPRVEEELNGLPRL